MSWLLSYPLIHVLERNRPIESGVHFLIGTFWNTKMLFCFKLLKKLRAEFQQTRLANYNNLSFLYCSFILWICENLTPLKTAISLSFEDLRNIYVLKESFMAKYVSSEVNGQKHNVLRRKFQSIKICSQKNSAALLKTGFLENCVGKFNVLKNGSYKWCKRKEEQIK